MHYLERFAVAYCAEVAENRRMLTMGRATHDEMLAHAAAEYPNECCGVLLGDTTDSERTAHIAVRCANTHAEPATNYAIAPHEVIEAQRKARELGKEIVGFYHSHPDHPALFSDSDLAQAFWVGCSYVVVGVDAGRPAFARSFALIAESNALEEPLRIHG